jgi:NAD(P)-dependent dehydrogenase (short-subunit alcohol dehydrogenase family)
MHTVTCGLLLSVTLLSATSMSTAWAAPSDPTVLITGANRGIGLALAQAYAAKNWHVVATCRDAARADALRLLVNAHPNVVIETLDVTDAVSLAALAAKYRGRPIDVLINNAGVLGDPAAQTLADFDANNFDEVMRVNSYAPLHVAAALLDSVAMSGQKKIISLTSYIGSIGAVGESQGLYYYRMSKAALNMGMRLLQNDVRGRGVIVGLISPGPVDTDMNRSYRGGGGGAQPQLLSPAQSAAAVVPLIERYTAQMGGHFYEYTGAENPW